MSWPPDNFEWVPGMKDKRVRCLLCPDSASSTSGLTQSTATRHIKSAGHRRCEATASYLANTLNSSDVETDEDLGIDQEEAYLPQEDMPVLSAQAPLPLPESGTQEDDVDDTDTEDDADITIDLPTLAEGDFHPFPSRTIFLLHYIASNPRNPLSRPQIKLILQLLGCLGFKDTPSYYKYQAGVDQAQNTTVKKQERVVEVVGQEGHLFCVTKIAHEVARDFSNPEARQRMTLYPRRDVEIKDLMDGDWVHSLRDERAAPMVRLRDGRHAFREEPVQLNDNRFILVSAWYQIGDRTYGLGTTCSPDEHVPHCLRVRSTQEVSFATSDIGRTGVEVAQGGYTHDHLGRDVSMKLFSATPSASAGEIMEEFTLELRTSKHTKSNLVKQTRLSAHGRVTAPEDNIRESGSSDAWTSQVCDELRKLHVKSKQPRDVLTAGLRSALHDAIEDRPWAALLDVQDFNPALQLPLELLHVVLLGFAKYLMRATIAELEPSDKIQLAAWLGDANVEGLGLDSKVRGGYMMRHSLSLNGKDFRAMLQIIPSALPKFLESGEHSRTLRNLTEAWIAAARLAAALYVSSIRRSKQNEYKASGASNYYSSLVDAPTY
ncbi:unnamed protein product [Tilletia caries]|uniref:Uncharacterized protein n=1 Tax=Tilletia caries TaxID=13290 RepID=A0ABN7ITB6_9BASI|nr:unnamed protein product [Tilletia caries]